MKFYTFDITNFFAVIFVPSPKLHTSFVISKVEQRAFVYSFLINEINEPFIITRIQFKRENTYLYVLQVYVKKLIAKCKKWSDKCDNIEIQLFLMQYFSKVSCNESV